MPLNVYSIPIPFGSEQKWNYRDPCICSLRYFKSILTLSLLGYLKTRICWGGVKLTPPSKSHVWCPNMTNDTSLESSRPLLLESAKNLQICKNWIFYRKIQLFSKNVCKKNWSKKWKIIHFWKALDHAISNMQKFLQNFKQPDFYLRKTKNVQISFDRFVC